MFDTSFLEVLNDCIFAEHLVVDCFHLPEATEKIKEVTAEVIQLKEEHGNHKCIISGELKIEIFYVTDNTVKLFTAVIPFSRIVNVLESSPQCKIRLRANARVVKCALQNCRTLEVKVLIILKGFVVELVNSKALCLNMGGNRPETVCLCEKQFASSAELDRIATSIPQYSAAHDVSKQTMSTFFVHNKGTVNTAFCVNEISPDGIEWVTDGAVLTVEPGESGTLVLITFLRYYRLRYWAAAPTGLDIWYQSQG